MVNKHVNLTDEAIHRLVNYLSQSRDTWRVKGAKGALKALLVSAVFHYTGKPTIFVTPSEKEARIVAQDVALFLGSEHVYAWPSWETVSADMFTFRPERERERIGILFRLFNAEPIVTILPAESIRELTMPAVTFLDYLSTYRLGDTVDREELVRRLLQGGYVRTAIVAFPGEFSVRGHIIDIFPPTEKNGIRLEFIGDEIESMREFDPDTQRSKGERSAFHLLPVREIIIDDRAQERAARRMKIRANELGLSRKVKEGLEEQILSDLVSSVNPLYFSLFYEDPRERDPLFSYFPEDAVVITDDQIEIDQGLSGHENAFHRLCHQARQEGKFYPEEREVFLAREEAQARLLEKARIIMDNLGLGEMEGPSITFSEAKELGIGPQTHALREEAGLFAPVAERVSTWLKEENRIIFVCSGEEEKKRMSHLLAHYGFRGEEITEDRSLIDILLNGVHLPPISLVEGKLSRGFFYPPFQVVLISESDIFGQKIPRRYKFRPPRESFFLRSFGELKEGDYVVHKDHGIGIYRGLEKIKFDDIENDFLLLEYAAGDKLYLPVDRLDRIQRYLGPENYVPRIDRLGGTSWENLKTRVKESIYKVAEELVAIYAARTVMERRPFSPTDRLYEEFCALFAYEETPDQAQAIEDVHVDMNKDKPMDRLICGDAGFGKTEVALRAAFRCVMDARQVAMLVPTTILAEQHFQTFRERFKNFPVRVEVLNRLRSRAETEEILRALESGQVDIVIGTHRLLQKDVKFRDLGLVIIDEEQRFGVKDKEKLKKLRTLVDVLTLTATPIPRTLHLALVGLRDMSVINTPPENRLPIKTYVVEFNDTIIADAIRRELARGGQAFFLHDRVRSIYTMAHYLERLVPEAKIAVVHGQLKPREIEEAMVRFVKQEANVLVCTSIVSAGLDIPTANTIIINRADRFGLAQLYQIRGRVGRFKEEAYAYLLIPKGAMLSRDAVRRLQVIMELTEPGSGFRLAASDLDIRGAGNILGLAQSGHVSAIGYELYTELMEQAIKEIKGGYTAEEDWRPEINLGISAFIPDDYMPDEHFRLLYYKRISVAHSDEELEEIRAELLDSHGRMPAEVENLFAIIKIRNRLQAMKVRKLIYNGREFILQFSPSTSIDPQRIISMIKKIGHKARISPDHVLTLPAPHLRGRDILSHLTETINTLFQG
ncbi:MAG TPA: transcription-repair coupling factor [Syntrophales bacterium]|nr:transcription-repair coupling factor [Syntrophales bacterium]HOL58397.1 transcription-repair coupling factor [Syntrophales bacterium]HPO34566.1 transcription-repair coupling factor [Syntrophales bacterium]